MIRGLDNAESAMLNKMKNIQIVANNLANLNTTGFKRGLSFSDTLEGEQKSNTLKVTDFTEGVFVETNSPMNAAISGNAFFTIKTESGEHLTKNGDFKIDDEGYLVTKDGYKVIGQNGEINLQDELIDQKDTLSILKTGELKFGDKTVAKLKMSKVEDLQQLTKTEGQLFYNEEKIYTTADENEFEVHHGYLESSNTNAIVEMQAMIQLQKDYEASQRMVTSIDAMLSQYKEMGKV
jgi:flagellar basal-body rod protein FlgG